MHFYIRDNSCTIFSFKMSCEFSGKVVLVTGASSGIGAAIAKHFSKLGATVVLTGRNVDNLKKMGGQCESPTLLIQADLTKEEDVKNIMKKTIEKYKKLDVLVNNAGIFERSCIEETSLESYDRVMNTNLRAVFQLTNLAVPHLIATKGNIINISSMAGLRPFPQALIYCMSKAALDHFTRCISIELAPKGVRVNSVNPGVIITEIFSSFGLSEEEVQIFLEKEIKLHALGRLGEPQEVADLVAFLVGEKAGFITGISLPIDGGRIQNIA